MTKAKSARLKGIAQGRILEPQQLEVGRLLLRAIFAPQELAFGHPGVPWAKFACPNVKTQHKSCSLSRTCSQKRTAPEV
jgi:hypothetical protein